MRGIRRTVLATLGTTALLGSGFARAADTPVADAQPAFRTFSAAPADAKVPSVQVETFGAFVRSFWVYTYGHDEWGGGVHARFAHGRFVVDGRFVGTRSLWAERVGEPVDPPEFVLDGVVRVGLAMVDRPRFRVVLSAGAGTTVEAGLSVWWRSPDGRFVFDAGANVAGRLFYLGSQDTWSGRQLADTELAPDRMMPEVGLSVFLADDSPHSLRFGHYGLAPTVGYRAASSHVAFEAVAGISVQAALVSAGVTAAF